MKNSFLLFIFSLAFSFTHAQTIPDFTLTDINGQEHSLYDDYLNNGMAVVINVSATWAPFDWEFHSSGILENFYQAYGGNGIQIMHLEADVMTTNDDLYGTGSNTLGNWVDGISYPIFNPDNDDLVTSWGLGWWPSLLFICPDGNAFSSDFETPFITSYDGLLYGELESPEYILDKITELCGPIDLNLNEVVAQVYLDDNDNCVYDADESFAPGFFANLSGNGWSLNRISSMNGPMRWFVQPGTYDLTVQSNNPNWILCNNSEQLDFAGTEDSVDLYFGAQAVQDCYDPTVDISASFLLRCFSNTLHVSYCNEGSITAPDATIEITLDSMFIFLSASQDPVSINGNVLTFEVGDLGVFECGSFEIEVEVSCDAELGDIHCYSAEIFPFSNCNITGPWSASEECQENVGSYDPNDKRAWPAGVGATNDILPNEDLKYQVRFQNTGTFMAINVVVLDTLSENVNLNSLRLGVCSHPYTFEVVDDRVLKWSFDNIMLPDSNSNEAASHGFLNYRIEQQADLLNGTTIENSAAIYFDFNDPIITNNYTHTINDFILDIQDVDEELSVNVFPNPNRNSFNVILDENNFSNGFYHLMDIHGKILQSNNIQQSQFFINHDLAAGLYILKIVNGNGKMVDRKILVQ